MNNTYTIKEVQILTRNDEDKPDYLENVTILVGDTICAQTGTDIKTGEWHNYQCADGGVAGDKITLYMDDPGRLSFCGIKAIATMDIQDYIELQSQPIYEQLEEIQRLQDCHVGLFGWYFFCTTEAVLDLDLEMKEEEKKESKLPKYYKYFLKNTMKQGLMYGLWSFYLDVSYQSDTELDQDFTPKVQFFSEWSMDEGEDVYYKTNKKQYYFIEEICGDDMYHMGSVCKFLWYYWMFNMSNTVFYSLFLVDTAAKFKFLKNWQSKAEGIANLFD